MLKPVRSNRMNQAYEEVIPLRSVVNDRVGSLTRNVRISIPADVARELRAMNIVRFVNEPVAVKPELPALLQEPFQQTRVPPRWDQCTAVVCASGPSFSQTQGSSIAKWRGKDLDDRHVIVVNDNWKRVPNADVLYGADSPWWQEYYDDIKTSGFMGELWTQDANAAALFPGLHYIESVEEKGAGSHDRIARGGNSGYQGICLARLWGAKRIVLVGFDMKKDEDGKAHWFGKHPRSLGNRQLFSMWLAKFPPLAEQLKTEGVEVVNATSDTALECFEQQTLSEALNAVA